MLHVLIQLLLLLLALDLPVQAANRHGMADYDPFQEMQAYWGDNAHGYAVEGCLHGPSATTNATMPPCYAYGHDAFTRKLQYLEDPVARTIPYSAGEGYYFLIAHHSLSEVIADWTRVQGTHYLWFFVPYVAPPDIPPDPPVAPVRPQPPVLPGGALFLSRSRVLAGAVDQVYDMRDGSPWTTEMRATATMYGVKGDGVTDDSGAISQLCTRARERWFAYGLRPQKIVFPPGHTYRIDSGVVCELNKLRSEDPGFENIGEILEIVFEAYGTKFVMTGAGIMWNWSPNTVCKDAVIPRWAEPGLRRVWWSGGTFLGPATYVVGNKMMRAYGIRGFYIRDTTASLFHTIMDVCVQDNFYVTQNRWGVFAYGIHQNDQFVDQEIGPNGGATASHVRVFNNLISGGQSGACVCNICLDGNSIQSAWIASNTISGECTRGWIHIATGDTDNAVNGPIVIEGNEMEQAHREVPAVGIRIFTPQHCATAVDPDDCRQPTVGLRISNNDMRIAATDGHTAIQLENVDGAQVTGNVMTPVGATNWTMIALRNSRNVSLDANHIQDPKGGVESPFPSEGVCIKFLDELNHDISLGRFFCKYQELEQYGGVDDQAMGTQRRWAWSMGQPVRFLQGDYRAIPETSAGLVLFDGIQTLSTGVVTLDMNRVNNLNVGFGQGSGRGVVPWGYNVRVHMKDTGSSTSPSVGTGNRPIPSVVVRRVEETGSLSGDFICSAAGALNNTWVSCDGVVRADVNGDIAVAYTSTGADTLLARVSVSAIYQ